MIGKEVMKNGKETFFGTYGRSCEIHQEEKNFFTKILATVI